MVETAVGQVARIGAVVRPADVLSVIHEDPDDDRVLEAAREGSADVIVSGDRHLLRLGSWEAIRIMRVAELLGELERQCELRVRTKRAQRADARSPSSALTGRVRPVV
jgi:predicted nucleic acid-binding protein